MHPTLFAGVGGRITLPDRKLVLVDREDGGHLCVVPARAVWERSALSAAELSAWSFLVAAAGAAMLAELPQLAGGCINYWEAGNWALHEQAEPKGPKTAPAHRQVHLHLLGRSRTAAAPAWRWGEAPRFPDFADRFAWAAEFRRLTADECRRVVARAERLLRTRYGVPAGELAPWSACPGCGYPTVEERCGECQSR